MLIPVIKFLKLFFRKRRAAFFIMYLKFRLNISKLFPVHIEYASYAKNKIAVGDLVKLGVLKRVTYKHGRHVTGSFYQLKTSKYKIIIEGRLLKNIGDCTAEHLEFWNFGD